MADQPPLRRRFQFRLRTLMIGVTLFAVVAGTIRVIGPPWMVDIANGQPTHDWSITCSWLIIIATELYVAWIVLRFASGKPPKQRRPIWYRRD